MSELRSEKYVNNLPVTLTSNTIYYVKTGSTFDMYITNDTGTIIAYPMNTGNNFNLIEVEIDFGNKPVRSKRFTISNSNISNTSKITVFPSGNIALTRGQDDWEWDTIQFSAKSNIGSFILYAYASGRIGGRRKIFYTINN